MSARQSTSSLTMQRHPGSSWRLWLLDKLVDRFDGPATEKFLAKLRDVIEATAESGSVQDDLSTSTTSSPQADTAELGHELHP